MPVKDRTIYPPYWKQFSAYIRFERAKSECEVCGLEHGAWGFRLNGEWIYAPGYLEAKRDGAGFYITTGFSQVILTVAHLDAEGDICRCQDESGFLCAKPHHVKAMCQRCHNRYDRPKRDRNAKATREAAADEKRILFNFQ